MRQVRIQKPKRIVTLGAVIAASALLSAFQPASATDTFETSGATGLVRQGDFEIRFVAMENYGGEVCATITNVVTGEYHFGSCGDAPVEISDTLDSASAAGTSTWNVYSTINKGRTKSGVYPSKSGTITVDMTWTGTGVLETAVDQDTAELLDPECWVSFETYCSWYVSVTQKRTSTAWGTVTDSEWGTFVIEGADGYMKQWVTSI